MNATAKKPEAEKNVIRKLLPGELKQADYVRSRWQITLKEGETLEDALKPEYWCHVGDKLNRGNAGGRAFDRIEVLAHDMSFYAELIVLDRGKLWAKVAVLQNVRLDKEKAEAKAVREEKTAAGEEGYTIKYHGSNKLWIVQRNSDKLIIFEGIGNKEDAQKKLDEHLAKTGETPPA